MLLVHLDVVNFNTDLFVCGDCVYFCLDCLFFSFFHSGADVPHFTPQRCRVSHAMVHQQSLALQEAQASGVCWNGRLYPFDSYWNLYWNSLVLPSPFPIPSIYFFYDDRTKCAHVNNKYVRGAWQLKQMMWHRNLEPFLYSTQAELRGSTFGV